MSEPLGRRPLRIAFLTPSLDVGGAERKMILLAERLDRDRYQTEFVLRPRRPALASESSAGRRATADSTGCAGAGTSRGLDRSFGPATTT